jgi:hypothetical protein
VVVASVARPRNKVASVARPRNKVASVARPRSKVASVVRRRIKVVLVVVVFRSNNNSRWEWEELQCKVVREWVRECKRRQAACNRMVVRAVVR